MPRPRKERARRTRRRLRLSFAAAGAPWSTGFTSDVSTSGLALASGATLPAGTLVALELRLPDDSVARAVAQVVWSIEPERILALPGQMGVRFLKAQPGFLSALGLTELTTLPASVVRVTPAAGGDERG